MATGKITKRSVDAAVSPQNGRRAYLWDDDVKGFGLMVTDRGVRSYIVQYRIGGRGAPTRRITIGRHGSPWTPDAARKRALELLELVRRNVDPFDLEREKLEDAKRRKLAEAEAQAAATTLAFSTFADRFIQRYAMVEQPRTWRDTESIFRRDLKSHFGDRPLSVIKPADIVELLEKVQERGDSAAIKAYKALRVMFGWAVEKHVINSSPMQTMKPPARIDARKRTLSDSEVRLLWIAAEALGWPFGPIVHLLVLTGQRRDEVGELLWAELDLPKRQWILPGERAKNEQTNLVPLSTAACSIIEALPVVNSPSGFVFTTTGTTPVSGFSKVKRRLDEAMLTLMRNQANAAGATEAERDALGLEPWRFHDLRRTLATGCQRLGVRLEVSEAILNHTSGTRSGIAGVYHVYKFEDEKRDALEAWAEHVANAVRL